MTCPAIRVPGFTVAILACSALTFAFAKHEIVREPINTVVRVMFDGHDARMMGSLADHR